MKNTTILISLIFFALTLNSQRTVAQTTLSQGDLSIVGFNSNTFASTGAYIGFAFVCWVNITQFTAIKFSLNTFNSSGTANSAANANTISNQTINWNNSTGATINAGTVITISGSSGTTMVTNIGTIADYGYSGSGGNGSSFTPTSGGKALFAFQNTGSSYSASSSSTATFNGNLLYGLCWAGTAGSDAWLTTGTSSSAKSYKPSDLSSSYQISALGAGVKYASYTGATSGFATMSALKAAVNNVSNWTAGSGTSYATFPGNLSVNTAPTFTNGTTTLSVCQNASATSVNSLLTISDVDASQTKTWSVTSSPSHGTLGGFNATASSGSTSITPTGLTYTPTNGYTGSDAFTIQISDGIATATKTITVTVNALPTITLGSNPSICNGVISANLTYSATTNSPNQYSITWNAGGIIAGFSNVSLTTLPASPITLTAPSNPGAGTYTGTLIVKNTTTGCSSTGSSKSIVVNPLTTISSASNQTHDVASASGTYTDGSCNIISTVQPSGANPVSGNVTSKIWIESSVPVYAGQPYVARHYEITPATNASTATGTVTLYYLQSEFDAFNAAPGSTLDLPTGSSDAAGKANLRIGKYSGTSSDNSGLPGTYSSGAIVIDPTDANIVWNASASRWEVTFTVSGFSGFIVQTSTSVLPVTWMSFTAEKFNEKVLLKWKTAQETNSSHFVIEHSTDGRHFTPVGSVTASGTSNRPVSYSFVHDAPQKETNYYRLLQVDRDGNKEYSAIRMINFTTINDGITILVNPVRDGQLQVQFDKAANTVIYDARGRIMMRQQTVPGSQVINVSNLPRGIYLLQAGSQAKKFIKE